jgi:uncharacterized protein (TIGR03067 family)
MMRTLARLDPGDRVLMLAILVLLAITVVIGLAALVVAVSARRDAAARHATWLIALVCVLLCPAAVVGLDRSGISWTVAIPSSARPNPAPGVEVPAPSEGVPREPARALRTDAVSAPPATAAVPIARPDRAAAAPSCSWHQAALLALALWALGAMGLIVRLLAGVVLLAAFRAGCRPVSDVAIRVLFEEVVRLLGFRSPPSLRGSDRLAGPIAVGVLRPAILLPEDLHDAEALREILIHEAAHLLRRDPLVGLLQRLAGAVFWIHPLVPLLNRGLDRAREEVCDNYVLRHGDRFRYSRALLGLARGFEAGPSALAALGLFSPRWNLADRITGLLDERRNVMLGAKPARKFTVAALLLAAGMISGRIRLTAAAPPAQDPPASSPAEKPESAATDAGTITENEVAGRVVDAEGKPLADVLVDAWSWYPGHETHTGKDGRFRLKVFTGPGYDPREGAQMRFSKEGYSPKTFPDGSIKGGTSDLVVTLTNTTYFEGSVTTPDGKPAAGVRLRASNPMRRQDGVEVGQNWTETRTDERGHYRLNVEPDTFDIQVRAPGVGVVRRTNEVIAEGQARSLDLPLTRGVAFRARIVDSQTGRPVPGVRLWNWQHPDIEARAGDDGVVRLDDMLPGRFEFQVGDERPFQTSPTMESHKLTRWWSEQCVSEWSRKKIENASDRYGKWQRNFDDLDFDLKPGMEPVTIEVETGVTIRGRVLDPDGQPVAGATVAPALTGSGNSLTGDTRFSVTSGADGRYEMLLPASNERDYNLVAHDGKYLEWRTWANGVMPPIRTRPGQVIDDYDITLTRPATVRGRVVDAQGRPVGNREVRASAADKLENRYYDPTTQRTDADGRFELRFIRPGKQYIQVYPFWLFAEQAPVGTSQTVELKAGEAREGIELIAQPDPRAARASTPPAPIVPAGVEAKDDPDARVADPGPDAEKIQGTWIVVELRQAGHTPTAEEQDRYKNGGFKIRITGDRLVYLIDQSGAEYRLNPSRTPKVMSLLMNGRVIAKAIYELNGDDLKICQGRTPEGGGPPRPPASFDIDKAPPGTSPTLFILKRDTIDRK